jgi:hypothetical protein
MGLDDRHLYSGIHDAAWPLASRTQYPPQFESSEECLEKSETEPTCAVYKLKIHLKDQGLSF